MQSPQSPQRRKVIKGIAAAVGTGAVAGYLPRASAGGGAEDDFSDIEHIIVLMMENRSFDHMLGWVPGADGVQAGRKFTDYIGKTHESYQLKETQNILGGDCNHSYDGARACYNGGAMDGFLRNKSYTNFAVGYFSREQVPFFSGCADHFTIGDRYFTGYAGPTYPNRFYMHTGKTDRSETSPLTQTHIGIFNLDKSIWDLCKENGVSGKYYYSDIPMTAFFGGNHLDISFPISQFLEDAANGTLPSVSFIDPAFIGESLGVSNDDHPLADISSGQHFMHTVYKALAKGPKWANTLLVINYDEWGGFADHVAPPYAPVDEKEAHLFTAGNDGLLGIRVPFVLVGPRARRNAASTGASAVVKEQYDPNAILNFICDRFDLPRLPVVRSKTSGSIATALLPRDQVDTSTPPEFANIPRGVPIVLSEVKTDDQKVEADSKINALGFKTATLKDIVDADLKAHLDDLRDLQQSALKSGFKVLGLHL